MKLKEQQEARALREQGFSIKEIARTLRVGVSSVSSWVSGIELTEEQLLVLEERQRKTRKYIIGRAEQLKRAAAVAHEKYRSEGYRRAQVDQSFRIVCALYWGEGGKSLRTRYFAVPNSDPRLLALLLRWLLASEYAERIAFRVQYYPDNGVSEAEIKQWWMEQLPGLEERHVRKFSRTAVHRASQQKRKGKLPYGTATLQVCSVRLYFNIMGGIDFLAESGT